MQSRPSLFGYCRDPETCTLSTTMPLLSLRVNVHRALLARDRPVNTRSVLRRATCAHTVCAGASK